MQRLLTSLPVAACLSLVLGSIGCESAAEPAVDGPVASAASGSVDAAALPSSASGPAAPAPAPPAKPARRFLVVEGDVTLNGAAAAVDAEIPNTAHIETKKGGRAVVSLFAGSAIEIRERSSLDLGTSARRKVSLSLLAGVVWSILPKGMADFEVTTSNAVAGVRGTTFFVDASKPQETYICVCDGEVDIAHGDELPRTVTSEHAHQGVLIQKKGKKTKLKDKGVARKGHTEDQGKALEELRAP